MFTLNNLTKIKEGLYSAESLPCPRCQGIGVVTLAGKQVFRYHQGDSIQDVLYDITPEHRERFMTGFCDPCWQVIMEEDL